MSIYSIHILVDISSICDWSSVVAERYSSHYIGTWVVTTKREPLSFSLYLIITSYPLRFFLGPTCLFVPRPLFVPPRHFILGCPLRFVRSVSAFHTWLLEAANTWHACGTGHARSNP